ncbi:lysylphosphatidylglycerol synthase domain-containing protein [Aeromicrobium sp. CTD01-1L150]|uniref:lysylphosphatidylglycerol synthase domain-containing protein n=1 Tax=Aeromicrobium sp. CTD01-1L150 TaxID=3341830 RepID=UPI0035C26B9B
MEQAAQAPKVWWKRKAFRTTVTVIVVGAVAALFTVSLVRNAQDVREQNLTPTWQWAMAIALFALAVPLTGLLWRTMLARLQPEAEVSRTEAISVQCASWLLKYIPGQVGSTVNKVLWAGRKGINRGVVVITVIYENVFLQVCSLAPGAAVVAAALGPQLFGDEPYVLLLPLLALVPMALVLWRPAFHRAVDVVARKALKRSVPREYFLSTRTTLVLLVGFLLPRLLNAAGFVVLATSVTDVEADEWAVFGAAYVLAGAIGILAVLVPSGLGVREAVIVVILAPYVGVPAAIVVSVLARLCSTVGDGLVAVIYVLTRRTIPKELRP